jgi:hypothetical protein
MSWPATAGGFLLGPIAGSLVARVVTDKVKPKELSTTLLIGSAVHAAAAVAAYSLAGMAHEENVHAFAYGTTWGSGIAAGLLGAGGLYAKTESGKIALSRYGFHQPQTSGELGAAAPSGLLGLLTAARSQGY